ncbi:MAG: hypothetical protein R8L53_00120, partial [Mariprofundales bacterium]
SGVVLQTVQQLYNEWLGTDHAISEGERGMRNIAAFIERYGDSRFQYDNRDRIVNDRAGWCRHNNDNILYHFSTKGFTEACNGVSAKVVKAELVKHDALFMNETDRQTVRIIVDGAKVTTVAIINSKLFSNSLKSNGVNGVNGATPYFNKENEHPVIKKDNGSNGVDGVCNQQSNPVHPVNSEYRKSNGEVKKLYNKSSNPDYPAYPVQKTQVENGIHVSNCQRNVSEYDEVRI